MTSKQLRFASEFLVDFSPNKAALRAGYSAGSAALCARRNLSNPSILDFIRARITKLGISPEDFEFAGEFPQLFTGHKDFSPVTREEVISILSSIARGGDDRVVTVKEQLSAIDMLQKYFSFLVDEECKDAESENFSSPSVVIVDNISA